MSEQWGRPVAINGKQPEWLEDHEAILVGWRREEKNERVLWSVPHAWTASSITSDSYEGRGWGNILYLKLPASHPHYTKPAQGPVDHPPHYGGADNPYECIRVIEAWQLGFNLGNVAKYIARAEHKGAALDDLRKAAWYLAREISNREAES